MGNSESTQTLTTGNNTVARGVSSGQFVSNNANAVATKGNAKAYIVQGLGALAMAPGPEGEAAAYTGGYTTGILSGNGQAGVEVLRTVLVSEDWRAVVLVVGVLQLMGVDVVVIVHSALP